MELLSSHIIKKPDLGVYGNLFGGVLLSWIDSAAAGYSMQLCDSQHMVTVSIDKCDFNYPGREGQLVKIYGRPTKVGRSSMSLYVEARIHDVYTGYQSTMLSTNMTFVHVNGAGRANPLSEKAKKRISALLEEIA